jgi:phage terminase large subunit-like protein
VHDIITDEVIAEKKASMTASLFACNYELKIIADENLLFSERPVGASVEFVRGAFCHIDAAYGGEDYTAFTAMAWKDGHFYIYGRCWQRHVEDCYADILFDYQRLSLGKCWNERNADKGLIAKVLKRKYGMRMVTYHESMNKYIKIATYLKAIWQYVIFVEGTDDEYINQILDYNEDAEHDDCADSAASLARKLYKKAGININVGLNDDIKEEEE